MKEITATGRRKRSVAQIRMTAGKGKITVNGKNIDEYFESKRLEMAKSMLLDSNNTVSVVTEKLGYPNIRYFSRLFKRITGVAPNNYRLSQN